jgi:CheY-like chemotaxis protein
MPMHREVPQLAGRKHRSPAMANVLITDLFEESAYLLRSILRGLGHAVSIAITREDAQSKLSTGLFDVLMVDFCTVVEENLASAKFAQEWLPGLPIVALTRPELESKLEGVTLTDRFHRPIRGQRVREAMQGALNALHKLASRRSVPRVHAVLPVEFDCAGVIFKSTTIDLSSRGVAIDATDIRLSPEQLENLESQVRQGQAKARIQLEPGRMVEVRGRVAFVERHRTLSGRTVGLCFEGMDEATEVALAGVTRAPLRLAA